MAELGFCGLPLSVPLFAELYGYGPFRGRRNLGTRDTLYCRAIALGDSSGRRIVEIVSDVCVTDDVLARTLRAEIAAENCIHPNGIMFGAIHTHTGPAVSLGIGWGEICPEFMDHLKRTIKAAAAAALRSMEPVTAVCGRAKLSKKVGVNRVRADGPTDESIRWIKFLRKDGSAKLLLYNHGMHNVSLGSTKLVSADWAGETTRQLLELKLAENVMFVYGAAGDINTDPVGCKLDNERGTRQLQAIGKVLSTDLAADIAKGGQPLNLEPLGFVLEPVELPIQHQTADELRDIASKLDENSPEDKFRIARLIEMAILLDQRKTPLSVIPDFQIIRAGDLAIYGFPGEPFYNLGKRIMEESVYPFAICSAVTNGNCRYFPTPETFDMFPDAWFSKERSYGYYEIYQGCGRYMPAYQRNIADFMVDKFLSMRA